MLPILKKNNLLWNIQKSCRDLEITFLKIYLKETHNRQEKKKKKPVISKFSDGKLVHDSFQLIGTVSMLVQIEINIEMVCI